MATIEGPSLPPALQTLLWLTRPIELMDRCYERYGPVFQLRLSYLGRVVFVCEPELVRGVFTADPDGWRAGAVARVLQPLVGNSSVLLLDGPEHLRQRKLLLPTFHGERLRGYTGMMLQVARATLGDLPLDRPFRLHPYMQRVTLEVILRVVFGLEDAQARTPMSNALAGLLSVADSPLSSLLLLPPLQKTVPGSPWRSFVRRREATDALIHSLIQSRRAAASDEERGDMLELLLSARDESGDGLTDRELRDELMTMLIAGHETTATALCWTIDRLLAEPNVLSTLLRELDEVTGGAELEPEGLQRLGYLDAVIKEALRLRPVLPIVGRQLTRPLRLADRDFEAGTVLAPCIYLAHRRPESFPEPEVFRPERFLNKRPDAYAWFPFGGGPRRCLGATFALEEMKVVLAVLLSRYRFERAERRPVRTVRRAITLTPSTGTRVRAYART